MYPKYKLLIKANSYAGNFYRELVSYVFGFYFDGLQSWVDDLYFLACDEFKKEMPKNAFINLLYYFDDSYGQTCCEFDDRLITVYFNESPIQYIKLIKNRLKKFPEVYGKSWEFANKNIKIKSISLLEVETVSTVLIEEYVGLI